MDDRTKFIEECKKLLGPWEIVQVRLGIYNELTIEQIKTYAKKDYSARQMEEIRIGLQDNLNIGEYCNAEYDANKMQQIRLSISVSRSNSLSEKTKDIKEVLKELEKITIQNSLIENKMNSIDTFVKQHQLDMENQVIPSTNSIIRPGEKQMDPMAKSAVVARPTVPKVHTKRKIKDFLSKILIVARGGKTKKENKRESADREIIDIISNKEYSLEQMQEISVGWKNGLTVDDIKKYADIKITDKKMKEIRLLLETLKNKQANTNILNKQAENMEVDTKMVVQIEEKQQNSNIESTVDASEYEYEQDMYNDYDNLEFEE